MIVAILLNGLVQGAAIVGITYCAARCIPERNASTRYALWFVALLALVLVPVLTVVSDAGAQLLGALRPPAGEAGIVISLLPVGKLARDATQFAAPVTLWIAAVWLTGIVFQGLRLVVSFARIERIRRKAEPFDVCGERVLLSNDLTVPIAAGLFDPVVILPRDIVGMLAPRDLERVIAHERAHITRHDIAGNFIQRLVETVLFFNPWVYVVGRGLIREREAACDDVAVRGTGTAGEYAECLAALARGLHLRQTALLTPSAFGSGRSVISRVERLIRNGDSGSTKLNYYSIGGTIMILAILTLALQTISAASTGTAHASQTSPASPSNVVASACSVPNADAQVLKAAQPDFPRSAASFRGFVNVLVSLSPAGAVTKATVEHSSGLNVVDTAVINAAKASTYSPARQNCEPVTGTYLFHAQFVP